MKKHTDPSGALSGINSRNQQPESTAGIVGPASSLGRSSLSRLSLGWGSLSGKTRTFISTVLTFLFTVLFVWWGMHFPGPVPRTARADTFPINCAVAATPTPTPIVDNTPLPSDTCNPTPTPYQTTGHPELEILPPGYQNPNRAQLAWVQYGGVAGHKKPGVLLVHAHNFNGGDAYQLQRETQDLADAGFFAASVFYELAPNPYTPEGYIPNQPCHENDGTDPGWRMNLEVDDIKNAIRAMRADSRCNGWVGIVGGSAGAMLTIAAALDTTPSGGDGNIWPFWFQNGHDDRPACAVMLSAVYDFADWTPPTGQGETDPVFFHFGMHNFAQTLSLSTLATLPLNPVNLVPGAIAHGWRPIYMFNSYYDHPTAYHQLVTMVCLLQSEGLTLGTDYQYLTVPGDQHAFEYWNSWDHMSTPASQTVGDDVIAFLKAQAGLP